MVGARVRALVHCSRSNRGTVGLPGATAKAAPCHGGRAAHPPLRPFLHPLAVCPGDYNGNASAIQQCIGCLQAHRTEVPGCMGHGVWSDHCKGLSPGVPRPATCSLFGAVAPPTTSKDKPTNCTSGLAAATQAKPLNFIFVFPDTLRAESHGGYVPRFPFHFIVSCTVAGLTVGAGLCPPHRVRAVLCPPPRMQDSVAPIPLPSAISRLQRGPPRAVSVCAVLGTCKVHGHGPPHTKERDPVREKDLSPLAANRFTEDPLLYTTPCCHVKKGYPNTDGVNDVLSANRFAAKGLT